jgi:hypothetical protein
MLLQSQTLELQMPQYLTLFFLVAVQVQSQITTPIIQIRLDLVLVPRQQTT